MIYSHLAHKLLLKMKGYLFEEFRVLILHLQKNIRYEKRKPGI